MSHFLVVPKTVEILNFVLKWRHPKGGEGRGGETHTPLRCWKWSNDSMRQMPVRINTQCVRLNLPEFLRLFATHRDKTFRKLATPSRSVAWRLRPLNLWPFWARWGREAIERTRVNRNYRPPIKEGRSPWQRRTQVLWDAPLILLATDGRRGKYSL